MKIQLFDRSNIHTLQNAPQGTYEDAIRFFSPFIEEGISPYIQNVYGTPYLLKVDDLFLPLLVVEKHPHNAYVCSPYGHYVSYGKESLRVFENRALRGLAKLTLNSLGGILHLGKIDSIVYVNNWFFSTDLHPEEMTAEHIRLVTDYLTARFPDQAIAYRSLNRVINGPMLEKLSHSGYHTIATRQVFLFDGANPRLYETRILKSDQKLLRETTLDIADVSEFTEEEVRKIARLYTQLHIQSHSTLNPQITERFIRHLITSKTLLFKGLKSEEGLVGIAGYHIKGNVMLSPFFGYDRNHADHATHYRLLSTSLLLEAKKRGALFNLSAGAAFYKTIRRAEGHLESMAVFNKHLSYRQRLSWNALRACINTVAPRYMAKY